MAVDPSRTPGTFGAPPAGAPYEVARAEDPNAHAQRVRLAQTNERELAPLIVPPAPRPGPSTAPKPAFPVPPSQSRLRIPGQTKAAMPSVTATPVETARIVLTDAPGVPVDNRGGGSPSHTGGLDPATVPVQVGQGAHTQPPQQAPPRPPVDPQTAALLNSPLAEAARRLQASRGVTHQPAASNSDSPSRGIPTPSTDPGKQITGGFGDAGDAQYYPLDGSELRELVRGLMSVIDAQIENDLRFSMAICYPRVSARVIVEIDAYAAGGDGGQYDPSFAITKIAAHDRTPVEVARDRADSVVFVLKADRREMTDQGESVSPPNAIRAELGLLTPRKQSIQTPSGRLIVDLPSSF